jgi:hypothetical protein
MALMFWFFCGLFAFSLNSSLAEAKADVAANSSPNISAPQRARVSCQGALGESGKSPQKKRSEKLKISDLELTGGQILISDPRDRLRLEANETCSAGSRKALGWECHLCREDKKDRVVYSLQRSTAPKDTPYLQLTRLHSGRAIDVVIPFRFGPNRPGRQRSELFLRCEPVFSNGVGAEVRERYLENASASELCAALHEMGIELMIPPQKTILEKIGAD